jgi:pimeloyl-ACP methyl ester carboxylesterase
MSQFDEKSFTTQDGLKIHYRDYAGADSEKTPVLCLPGSSANSMSFDDMAPRYAADRRVLTLDWRGHGNSDWDPDYKNYGFETDRDAVYELLKTENLDRIVIIGTSRGGLIAMFIALTRPELLAGVVLNDIGPVVGQAGLERLQRVFALNSTFGSYQEAGQAMKERLGITVTDLTDEDWTRHATRAYAQNDDGKFRPNFDPGYARSFAETKSGADLWPLFEALAGVPTLAIRGEKSDVLESGTLDEMARRNPNLITATIPGRTHCPYLDKPASLKALDSFLGSV